MTKTNAPTALEQWIIRFKRIEPPRMRLFCFPHAGGLPSIYYHWASRLPPGVEVNAVQLPGRGTRLREPVYTSIPAAVVDLAAVLPIADGVPFAFFGHSMGSIFAFELARALRTEERPLPRILFASGHRAPQLPDRRKHVHALPDPELLDELRRLGGTPESVLANEELLRLTLPMVRADYTAIERYQYREEPPLPCPIVGLGGDSDPDVLDEELAAWGAQTTSAFAAHIFPGGHFYLHPQLDGVLATVAAAIDGSTGP